MIFVFNKFRPAFFFSDVDKLLEGQRDSSPTSVDSFTHLSEALKFCNIFKKNNFIFLSSHDPFDSFCHVLQQLVNY